MKLQGILWFIREEINFCLFFNDHKSWKKLIVINSKQTFESYLDLI